MANKGEVRLSVDPVTLEVIRHGLASITDQIEANITRTAFSPYIYEYKDYAVGLVGADGCLIAQSRGGIPIFVADSVGMAVRDGLQIYGVERLHHGDVVLCNAAAVQGQHLNNTVMYTPIYAGARQEKLIGFFAINVHWIDVGGSSIGAATFHSIDIFMEGLQIRTVKLWSRGEPIEEVYRIIENNTRFPQELLGDIAAQLGGCLMGRDLTAALADKYGVEVFLTAVETILDQSEASSRAKIRALPDGVYAAEAFLDDDGVNEATVPVKVRIIIDGDEMTIDFSDMPDQLPTGLNSGRYGGGQTIARVAFKYLIATDESANEGTFRPLKMILPDGKMISASPTAPMVLYSSPMPTMIDVICKALQKVMADRVAGGHFGSHSSVRFYRNYGSGAAAFNCLDSGHGGWGACATHDGGGPFRTMAHGDTRLIPMEVQESMYPFRVEELVLRQDSGGAGKWRGGLGFVKTYRILEPCLLWVNFDRVKCRPWGVNGGKEGLPGRVSVFRQGVGAPEIFHKTEDYPLNAGDVLRIETGGGGGYGAPEERAIDLVRRDVSLGYVSAAAAALDYGVDGAA